VSVAYDLIVFDADIAGRGRTDSSGPSSRIGTKDWYLHLSLSLCTSRHLELDPCTEKRADGVSRRTSLSLPDTQSRSPRSSYTVTR
jgi:hypothetical protein